MTLPFREWTPLKCRTTKCESADNQCISIDRWTADHLEYSIDYAGFLGHFTPQAGLFDHWHALIKSFAYDFKLESGADEVVDYGIWLTLMLNANSSGSTQFDLYPFILVDPADPNKWDLELVNGKYYDGVNPWGNYPPGTGHNYFDQPTIQIADLPLSSVLWCESYGTGYQANNDQEHFFRNGARFVLANYLGGSGTPFPVGEETTIWLQVQKIRINYLNPVVNTLSRNSMKQAGGVELILSGLGFDQDNAELGSKSRFYGNNPLHDWDSLVDRIVFEGQNGQGNYTLNIWADFTVDSDEQITIPSMPSMDPGSYRIKLLKIGMDVGDVSSYAGTWRASNDGRMSKGAELGFYVSDVEDRSNVPIILTKWRLRDKDGNYIFRHIAPIDIRAPNAFYEGRLKSVSGLSRAINDETGLYITSDMNLDVVNTDKYFSKLLHTYFLKNQPIELFFVWGNQPEIFKQQMFRGYVEEVSLKGGALSVTMKDLTTKYFNKKIPKMRVTEKQFPNAHENALGRVFPIHIGHCAHTATDASGMCEALYIDTVNHKYLADAYSLKSIYAVFSDGAIVPPANYSVIYENGGRTCIKFTADQGQSKITFNSKGYTYAPLNSINGYVQHPVYVLLFFLYFIAEIPADLIDRESFEKVKELLDAVDSGIATSGYLPIEEERVAQDIIQEELETLGAALFPDKEGRFKLELLDISSISSSKMIYSQIHTMSPPERDYGYIRAVNQIKANYNFVPAAQIFKGSKSQSRSDSIKDFEEVIESSQDLNMRWTTSGILVDKRLSDELYKRGYGYRLIKFATAIDLVDYLDIYSIFRLQDPFAVSADGLGDVGRYCYVEKVDYDFEANLLSFESRDLSFILRKYLILGSEDVLASNWSSAPDEDKAFAYLCNETTGNFADGEAGKILIDENKIAI